MAPTLLLPSPGPEHTSPQGAYRRKFSPLDHEKPTRAHLKAFARVTSGLSVVTPTEFDSVAIQFQGWQYSQVCDRCGGSCHSFDCSGLMCHVLDILGIGIGCCTSFVMANLCYQNGLYIDYATAEHTLAHWAFKGAWGGRSAGPGGEGHIVEGRGNGQTMEAMGRRWGCLIGNWYGRAWDGFARIPGVNYIPPPPPWKVQPVYNPALETRDILNDPGRGAWIGLSDGTVIYSGPNNEKLAGGMTKEPSDAAHFRGHTLARLHPRKRKDGSNGYWIEDTYGSKYVPIGQV